MSSKTDDKENHVNFDRFLAPQTSFSTPPNTFIPYQKYFYGQNFSHRESFFPTNQIYNPSAQSLIDDAYFIVDELAPQTSTIEDSLIYYSNIYYETSSEQPNISASTVPVNYIQYGNQADLTHNTQHLFNHHSMTHGNKKFIIFSQIGSHDEPCIATPTEEISREPMYIFCPFCNQAVCTVVSFHMGSLAWISTIVLSLVLACFIPIFFPTFKDVKHKCPACKKCVAINRRL